MPSPPLPLVQSLSPRIAVLASDDVTLSCEANGCTGLEELLRPWEGGTERVSILSSTLTPTIHPTFPLRFVSWSSIFNNSAASSPNPDMVVDTISSLVAARKPEDELHYSLTRSLLLSSRPLAPHETFNHPVAVVFAVSTAEPDPLGSLKRLQNTMAGASMSVPWMDSVNLMRFYVVIHDVSRAGEDLDIAHEILSSVKKLHGPHSTLLVTNSQLERRAPPASPDVTTHSAIPMARPFSPEEANPSALSQVYASALSSITLSPMASVPGSLNGPTSEETSNASTPATPVRKKLYAAKLTAEDTQRLAALVRELVVQSLVPWMEARIREWNEVYQSNRRGITGRLFGAGRKFFGSRPATPAPNSTATGYNTVKGYYPVTSVEALSRRLADFAFMLRDYRFATSTYDSLRRDFAQDRAMRYAAASTEMYGLSQLLSHPYFLPSTPPRPPTSPFTTLQHTEISSWLEQAVVAYNSRAPASQIQLDALRITVLYYEAWKMIGEWRGVGYALVRAAGEADEVPSAVMIEEAAAADVKGGRSQRGRRRRAFHLVMAARRYETAGLKTYSRRCLDRASQIYRSAPWTAAQDRVEYSLGRQAYTLGESDVAVEHFLRLLRREDTGVPGSQGMVLEDMALAYEASNDCCLRQLVAHPQLLEGAKDKIQLPTPIFDVQRTQLVASSSVATTSGTRERWEALETQALNTWDRKGKKPMSLLPPQNGTVVSVGETFHVELVATNPLNAPLVLKDVTVIVDPSEGIEIETMSEISLEAYETRPVLLAIQADRPTTLHLSAVTFLFNRFFPCRESLEKRGKRLHSTQAQRVSPTYAKDASLRVTVEASKPTLSVELLGLPSALYEGEEVEATLQISNVGNLSVEDVRVLLSESGILRLRTPEDTQHTNTAPSIPNLIAPDHSIELHPSALDSGGTAHINVTLTGIGSGIMEVLGLVIFSGTEDVDKTAAAPLSFSFEVLPLLRLSAHPRASWGADAAYIVPVETTNVSASPVRLDTVHPISAYWKLSAASTSSETTLYPNQTDRCALRVDPAGSIERSALLQPEVVSALSNLVKHKPAELSAPSHQPLNLHGLDTCPLQIRPSYAASRRRYRLASLEGHFPTIPADSLSRIFPLLDALDLDLIVKWTIPSSDPALVRSGHAFLHGARLAPESSVVEDLRREVDAAIAGGGKQTRTMYEETGRLRRVLMDSVLDGVLSREEDPVIVKLRVDQAKRGVVQHDFGLGQETPTPAPFAARFFGAQSLSGALPADGSETATAEVWVDEPGLVSLDGWTLAVETGDELQDASFHEKEQGQGQDSMVWRPRFSWTRRGEGGTIDVMQA